ncbi:cutinase family protein [Mycolicibacterium komossense]|jgi:cutinase|uniref:Cutinase n=1 Tax=Mycolicibacterium komossense TaxID=1779 RepID=A0ABT3CDC1_9MYCO|nr:cutinase family protein [Mycolicibacterium komossense]MCV7227397.1 cutinase family protein [Mycolicibacterium komossense]
MSRLRTCCATLISAITAAATLFVAPTLVTGIGIPSASAACPDVEVIFARGRLEPPGAGQIGNAFVSGLRSKTGKNINLYSVQYPADNQVDIGANDMSQRIQSTAATCPNTRIVLGGYSLGAAVTDVVLAVPMGFMGFKNPLPGDMSDHIAAVAVFGNGSQWVGPLSNFNPVYGDRTIELCHGDDPICNPTDPNNWQDYWPQHLAPAYIGAGMVDQAVDFVAGRL